VNLSIKPASSASAFFAGSGCGLLHFASFIEGRAFSSAIDIRSVRHWLAERAPKRDARVCALNAAANRLAAAAARLARAAVDPQAGAGIGCMCGAPLLAAISDDQVAGVLEHVGAQQLFRGSDGCGGLAAGERTDRAERMKALDETDFRFEDIADAG
jgi:hypothetical protein